MPVLPRDGCSSSNSSGQHLPKGQNCDAHAQTKSMPGFGCEHVILSEEDAALLHITSSSNSVWASTKAALTRNAAACFTTHKTVVCCKDLQERCIAGLP